MGPFCGGAPVIGRVVNKGYFVTLIILMNISMNRNPKYRLRVVDMIGIRICRNYEFPVKALKP